MSKAEEIIEKLDSILSRIDGLYEIVLHIDRPVSEDESFEAELEQDYEPPVASQTQYLPRTRMQVKGVDSTSFEVEWNDLDPRVQEAIEASNELDATYQLYEDQSGVIRISIDSRTGSLLAQRHAGARDNIPNP